MNREGPRVVVSQFGSATRRPSRVGSRSQHGRSRGHGITRRLVVIGWMTSLELVHCCTLPSPNTTLPLPLCMAAVQDSTELVVISKMSFERATPLVARLRSPHNRVVGSVSAAVNHTK
jgi:hypothetical protein